MDIAQIVPQMGDEELAAYRFLVTTGGAGPERVARSLGWGTGRTERVLFRLGGMRLAQPSRAEDRSEWTAVHPDMVKLHYAKPLAGVIDTWQAQLEGLRAQLDTLSGLGAAEQGEGVGPVVTIDGASDIHDALTAAASHCTDEVLAVQPLDWGASAVGQEVVCGNGDSMPPAAGVRVLFPHVSRFDAQVREHTERILGAGGEVRTTAASLPPLVVFDRSVIFLFDDGDTDTAHMVQHRALVDFMVHTIVSAWTGSAAFEKAGGSNRIPDSLTHETKTAIVQLLTAGYKDEVVAKRLSIGVRTCRKYIAELFDDLGAQSRFQAGWTVRDRMLAADRSRKGTGHCGD